MKYYYETPATELQQIDGVGPWTARKLWCQANCQGTWEYAGVGRFEFEDFGDYFWFLLKWS